MGKPSLPAARGLQQSSQAGRNARFLPGPQGHGWYSSGCTVHGDTIVLWARVTSPLPPSSFSIPHVLCRLICVIPASVIRRRTHYCGDITRWKNVLKCLSCHVSHGLHSACRRVSSSRVEKETNQDTQEFSHAPSKIKPQKNKCPPQGFMTQQL